MDTAVSQTLPLCVDLDGTLIRSDLLVECVVRLAHRRFWLLLLVPFWLLRGRAYLKRRLAEAAPPEIATLPWEPTFLAWLRDQHLAGREIWLATAADETLARQVAAHLGLFRGVVASDGATVNLKGQAKFEALRRIIGGPFEYAGNDYPDLAVWRHCPTAIVVNAPASLVDQVRRLVPSVSTFACGRRGIGVWLRAMRIHQWAKNVLILVPLVTAHRFLDPWLLLGTLIAFVLFGLCSSAQYILNDLIDLDADRHHPTKAKRPFASGEASLAGGLALFVLLLGSSLLVASAISIRLALALAGYFVLSLSYSLWLKRLLIADVFVLASLYSWRIIVGHVVTGVIFSEWLLSFAFFLFLSLGFGKRMTELLNVHQSGGRIRGRAYRVDDIQQVNLFGVCSAFLAAVVFLLYLQSDKVKSLYREPALLWLLCPVLLYWLTRIWVLSGRGEVHEDPVLFVLKDRVTYVTGAIAAVIMFAAKTGV